MEQLFSWAFEAGGFDGNWGRGLALFSVGAIGALIAVFFTLGGFLPSMGRGDYEIGKVRLDDERKRRDALLFRVENGGIEEKVKPDLMEIAARLDASIARGERQLSAERWRLLALGMPVYVLLGGVAAAAVATTLLQAFVVGFGWTAVIDRFGLSKEVVAKQAERAPLIERLGEAAVARAGAAGSVMQPLAPDQAAGSPPSLAEIESMVRRAKAL